MSLLTYIQRMARRIKFCTLNASEIDRLCLAERERSYEDGGTLPASLRKWLLSLDLTHTAVLEMRSPNKDTRAWFCNLVSAREVKSYTYFESENWGDALKVQTDGMPFRLVILNDPTLDDYMRAQTACDSHGVIILNSTQNHDAIIDYARNHGCGAIQFVGDMRDITGSYEVATVVFRHSAIFR